MKFATLAQIQAPVDKPARKRGKRAVAGRCQVHGDDCTGCARTKKEPPKRRLLDRDDETKYGVRYYKHAPAADTWALRQQVEAAIKQLGEAREVYHAALAAVDNLPPLPDTIIKDLPKWTTRYMRKYRAR